MPSSPPTSAQLCSTPVTACLTSQPHARPTSSSPRRATVRTALHFLYLCAISLTNNNTTQISSPTAHAKTLPSPSSRTGAPSSPPSRRSWQASRACRRLLTRASRTSRLARLVCKQVTGTVLTTGSKMIHDRRTQNSTCKSDGIENALESVTVFLNVCLN